MRVVVSAGLPSALECTRSRRENARTDLVRKQIYVPRARACRGIRTMLANLYTKANFTGGTRPVASRLVKDVIGVLIFPSGIRGSCISNVASYAQRERSHFELFPACKPSVICGAPKIKAQNKLSGMDKVPIVRATCGYKCRLNAPLWIETALSLESQPKAAEDLTPHAVLIRLRPRRGDRS